MQAIIERQTCDLQFLADLLLFVNVNLIDNNHRRAIRVGAEGYAAAHPQRNRRVKGGRESDDGEAHGWGEAEKAGGEERQEMISGLLADPLQELAAKLTGTTPSYVTDAKADKAKDYELAKKVTPSKLP